MKKELLAELELRIGRHILSCEKLHSKGEKYHVKLIDQDGNGYSYKEIQMIPDRSRTFRQILSMEIPVFQKVHSLLERGENKYGILSEWVDGKSLDPSLWRSEEDGLLSGIRDAALALRKLHQSCKTEIKRSITMEAAERVIGRSCLSAEEKETILCYIRKHLPLLSQRCLTVVHGDLHLKNIMRSGDQTIFIDLDDVKYGDAYMDLVYAGNLHYTCTENDHYYMFLHYYFDGKLPEDFWPTVNIYSISKALEIINYEKEQCAGDSVRLSMSSFLKNHDHMQTDPAKWYMETEKLLNTTR